jgi:hypothetical protein
MILSAMLKALDSGTGWHGWTKMGTTSHQFLLETPTIAEDKNSNFVDNI